MQTNEPISVHFQAVFNQHYNALCNYAYSYLKDFDASEDLVQELFIRIWEKRKDLVEKDAIRYYLYTSVRNNCLTHLKKAKKNILVPLQDEDAAECDGLKKEDNQPHPASFLEQALQQLPPKCREVFLLSRVSKQSYLEIADQLGISVKTVENQIGKALKVLRVFAKKHNIQVIIATLLFFFNHYRGF